MRYMLEDRADSTLTSLLLQPASVTPDVKSSIRLSSWGPGGQRPDMMSHHPPGWAACRYIVYVDGQAAGQLPVPGSGETTADAGQPVLLSSADIFLCSRSDGSPDRYFSGSISHLALWNTALSGPEVRQLVSSPHAPV